MNATHFLMVLALAALGLSRRVSVVVPSFTMVLQLLCGSDMMALLPSRCITPDVVARVAAFEPPIPIDGFHLDPAWHVRGDRDMAIRHVADEIRAVLA